MIRKIRVLQRSLLVLSFICVSMMTFVEASAEDSRDSLLNKDEVRLLEDAAFQLGVSVPDLLGVSFHSWGGCDYNLATCTTPVKKRGSLFGVGIQGGKDFPTDHLGRTVRTELTNELRKIGVVTGLELNISLSSGTVDLFSILFVDPRKYKNNLDLYLEATLDPWSTNYADELKEPLVQFLNSPSSCESHVIYLENGEIQASFLWIKTDIEFNLIKGCIVAHPASAVGLGVEPILQAAADIQERNRSSRAFSSVFRSISPLLRILYLSEVKVGSNFRENYDLYTSLIGELD